MDEDCFVLQQRWQRLAPLVCDDVNLQSSLVQPQSQFDCSHAQSNNKSDGSNALAWPTIPNVDITQTID